MTAWRGQKFVVLDQSLHLDLLMFAAFVWSIEI